MLTTKLNSLNNYFLLLQVGSHVSAFFEAKVAGTKIFEVIDRIPEIDILSTFGDAPNVNNEKIEFRSVDFCYPSRPDVQVNHIIEYMLLTLIVV